MLQQMMLPLACYMLYNNFDKIKQLLPTSLKSKIPSVPAFQPADVINFAHVSMLLSTMFYLIPLNLIGFYFNSIGFSISLYSMIAAGLLTIITNRGAPPFKEGWEPCKMYLAQVQQSVEFPWMFYALIFLGTNGGNNMAGCNFIILLIPFRRSLNFVMKSTKKKIDEMKRIGAFDEIGGKLKSMNFPGMGSAAMPTYEGVAGMFTNYESYDADLIIKCNIAEILLGFYLLVMVVLSLSGIVSTVNSVFDSLIPCLMYWGLLRVKFHLEKTSAKQVQAWNTINDKIGFDTRVMPMLPPFVAGGVEKVKGFYKSRP